MQDNNIITMIKCRKVYRVKYSQAKPDWKSHVIMTNHITII